MINKKTILFKLIMLIIIFVLINPITSNSNDIKKNGQININLEEKDYSINVNIYQIKRISDIENMIQEYTDEFRNLNLSENIYDNSNIMTIRNYINENNLQGISINIDKQGIASFKNLELGMYLITIDTYEKNGKNYTINPFIIEIPQHDEKIEWNYIVTAYPKIFEEISNNDNISDINGSQLNNSSNDELPETGMLIWPIPIFAFTGLIFFVIGYFLYVKGCKND